MSHRNDREPGDGHARQNLHARRHTHTAAVHIAQFRLSQAALPRIETASRTAARRALSLTIAITYRNGIPGPVDSVPSG